MDILVCMKQVPDTESKIRLKAGEKAVDTENLNFVINPFDEFAIEEALRIREKLGGTVTLVSMGPTRTQEALRTGLAMGADRAIHLQDDAFDGADAWATAKVLAKAVQGLEYDLILCGKQAIDDDSAQVAALLAEMLDLPQVTVVTKLEIAADGKSARAHREIEGGVEVVETSLPAVITAQKGLNEPRYPSLPGIMKAKKKEIKVLDAVALGFDAGEVGRAGSRLETVDVFLPPARQAGRVIEGEPAEVARELARLLREEAKVI